MKLKLIGCEVILRELCNGVARSPHQVDFEYLPKGLHDLGGKKMAAELQARIDAVAEGAYEAIVMGYGLCGNGMDGVTARHTMLVVPRTHDCIALLMGSRERYQEYFDANPGTYFRSTGWLERGKSLQQLTHQTQGMEESLEKMIERYGEDNGRYLYEELTRYRTTYSKMTYIATGLETSTRFEDESRAEAEKNNWKFERLEGNLALLNRLLDGEWDGGDFLVARPGQMFHACYDERIMRVVDAQQ